MNLIKQLWILIFIYLLGEVTAIILPSPLPGNVLGFIYLFIALKTRIIKSESITNVSNFFLKNLALLFIPGGVGIVNVFYMFNGNIVKIFLIITISIILTMISTAGTIILLDRIKK